MTPTLFQRLLGAEFYYLAPEVKALHARQGTFRYEGRCTVERGRNPLGRLAGALMRLPPAMIDAPLAVVFDADGARETWQRSFGGKPMRSRLVFDGGRLRERLGPGTFHFRLFRIDGDLHWVAEKLRVFGFIPVPARWLDDVRCREFDDAGRYGFEVEAHLPLFGLLVRYRGWLMPVPANDA